MRPWAADMFTTTRGPWCSVRKCKFCGHVEVYNYTGGHRGAGMVGGNKANGRMIEHIKTAHPEKNPNGPAKPVPATTRVNKVLKANGRPERFVRGRGYYYLQGYDGYSSSLAVYRLGSSDADYSTALAHVVECMKQIDVTLKVPG